MICRKQHLPASLWNTQPVLAYLKFFLSFISFKYVYHHDIFREQKENSGNLFPGGLPKTYSLFCFCFRFGTFEFWFLISKKKVFCSRFLSSLSCALQQTPVLDPRVVSGAQFDSGRCLHHDHHGGDVDVVVRKQPAQQLRGVACIGVARHGCKGQEVGRESTPPRHSRRRTRREWVDGWRTGSVFDGIEDYRGRYVSVILYWLLT